MKPTTTRLAAALAALLLAALPGCNKTTPQKGAAAMPARDMNQVMQEHFNELMAIPGVAGVAMSETDDHKPCVVIYVVKLTDDLKARLPATIETLPVRLEESGEFKPLKGETPAR